MCMCVCVYGWPHVHVRVRIRLAMARDAFAAPASPRTAALARSSPVTHCSRASSCRVRQQMSALADYVQASLMLNYNGRRVG